MTNVKDSENKSLRGAEATEQSRDARYGRSEIATPLALLAMTISCTVAHAQQAYPAKPVTLLIPFSPGTGNDLVGRIVGGKLSESLGQRFVADNRAGASGNIAVEAARRAAPDGYTLVVASVSFSINPYTMGVSYKLSDFTPVAKLGTLPYTLMVSKGVTAGTLKELVTQVKAKPDQFTAGSGGPTGSTYFITESFKKAIGVNLVSVAYKGTTDGVLDLLAGRTQLMFSPLATSIAQHRAGKVNVLGITGAKRSPLMPSVPTFTEQGYPSVDMSTWFALLGPAGTPANAVKVVSEASAKALASREVADALMNQGIEPSYAGPADLEAFLKADLAMWSKLVKELGVTSK